MDSKVKIQYLAAKLLEIKANVGDEFDALMILGVKYADDLEEHGIAINVLRAAGINERYGAYISDGKRISRYVTLK